MPHDYIRQNTLTLLTYHLPLYGQAQLTRLFAQQLQAHPLLAGANWHQRLKICGRWLIEALAPPRAAGLIRDFTVVDYLLCEVSEPAPLLRWSPGDPDPDFELLDASFRAHIENRSRKIIQPVKALFVPRHVPRPQLETPLFRETLNVAETVKVSARFEEPIVALRAASMYLNVAQLYPASLPTWEVTRENLFGPDTPLHAEACIRIEQRKVALRTCRHAEVEKCNQFHARMKHCGQSYIVL